MQQSLPGQNLLLPSVHKWNRSESVSSKVRFTVQSASQLSLSVLDQVNAAAEQQGPRIQICHDVQWCTVVSSAVQWCVLLSSGVQWCLEVSSAVQWCPVLSTDAQWWRRLLMIHSVGVSSRAQLKFSIELWRIQWTILHMVFSHVQWCMVMVPGGALVQLV